jgi:hypothetical protein
VQRFRSIDLGALKGAFTELRAGTPLSAANTAILTHCLSLASSSDNAVDELQIVLSDLLGVVNPDIAQDAALNRDGDGAAAGGGTGDTGNSDGETDDPVGSSTSAEPPPSATGTPMLPNSALTARARLAALSNR